MLSWSRGTARAPFCCTVGNSAIHCHNRSAAFLGRSLQFTVSVHRFVPPQIRFCCGYDLSFALLYQGQCNSHGSGVCIPVFLFCVALSTLIPLWLLLRNHAPRYVPVHLTFHMISTSTSIPSHSIDPKLFWGQRLSAFGHGRLRQSELLFFCCGIVSGHIFISLFCVKCNRPRALVLVVVLVHLISYSARGVRGYFGSFNAPGGGFAPRALWQLFNGKPVKYLG